jgi:hypothetical protein
VGVFGCSTISQSLRRACILGTSDALAMDKRTGE